MSSTRTTVNRRRKNVEDVLALGGAIVLAVAAILAFGPVGLAAGIVLLSAAAAVVVAREDGSHEPADQPTTDERVVTDGGRTGD